MLLGTSFYVSSFIICKIAIGTPATHWRDEQKIWKQWLCSKIQIKQAIIITAFMSFLYIL